MKWLVIGTGMLLGVGLVLEPRLISSLPQMLHYIIGGALIASSAFYAYKEIK